MLNIIRTFNPVTIVSAALLLLVSSSSIAAEKTPESIDGTTRVTAEEVIELVGNHDDLVVIDARIVADRAQGWIEDSVSLPNIDTTPETLAKVAPDKSKPVLFLCNGVKCGRSVESSKNAVKWGYKKIYWFRGGMEEWENKGLPTVKE
jgi:rhodanese-related sulfurtransferase